MRLDKFDVDQFIPKAEKLGLKLYAPSPEADALLVKLWMTLSNSKDMERLIIPSSRGLIRFVQVFSPPTLAIYSVNSDINEIDFIFWLNEASDFPEERTVFGANWASPVVRGTKIQLRKMAFAYSSLFTVFDYCLGITWQTGLLPIHQKLGYEIVGYLPHIYGLDHVYTVCLKKENFFASKMYKIFERMQRRE